jgi:tRNA A-37 threonylcarbamoyl transferase component Bud32
VSGADSKAEDRADDRAGLGLDLLAPGRVFARYQVVRCIGVGGMGAVFEAQHTLLKKRVALKTLHTSLVRSEASRARFLREAETVARIRHPNVVDISDVGIESGVPFLVMEFLLGEDLARLLRRENTLEPRIAVDAVLPVVAGLCAVHRLGIVHRDVKPENIFLSRDAQGAIQPKLIDFGVSKDLDASQRGGVPGPHTVTGTPHYMSPEQARGAAQLDGRTDQYAIGVLLYQCLSGGVPYQSQSLLELIHLIDCGEYRPLNERRAGLPPELEAAVHRAMARNPGERFPGMEALGQALAPFASERTRVNHERDFAPAAAPILSAGVVAGDPTLSMGGAKPAEGFERELGSPPARTTSGVRVRHEAATPVLDPVLESVAPAQGVKGAWWLTAAVAAAFLCALMTLFLMREPVHPETSAQTAQGDYRVSLSVEPLQAVITLDGAVVGHGALDQRLVRDGREHVLGISAQGFAPQTLAFRDAPPRQSHVTLAPLPGAPEPVAKAPEKPAEPAAPQHQAARARTSPHPAPRTTPQPADLDIQLSR